MSTLRMIAWGAIDFAEADGPTRDKLLKKINTELSGYHMYIECVPFFPPEARVWRLRSKYYKFGGYFPSKYERERVGFNLRAVCQAALAIIEPSNYPSR